MRATTTASASSPIWRHGDFYFRTATSRRRWCDHPWNNFLRSLLRFIVVRSGHNEGLGRISFRSVFLILRWQKEEERSQKKEKVSQLRLQECWSSFVGHLLSGLLPSVCLCGHLYESSYRFGVEILGYTKRGYNLDDQVLDIRSIFQCACNVMMYSAMI